MKKRKKSPKTNPIGKDAKILQVNLTKATARAVKEAADKDLRSVSNWIELLIVREFQDSTEDEAGSYGEPSKRPKLPPLRDPSSNEDAS